MQGEISHSKTESIIYKLVRDKSLDNHDVTIIDEIIENKDYKKSSKPSNVSPVI